MSLNLLFLVMFFNRDDPVLIQELLNPCNQLESSFFRCVKLSLEIPIIPIKKILMLFYVYLKFLLGVPKEAETKVSEMKYPKDLCLLID